MPKPALHLPAAARYHAHGMITLGPDVSQTRDAAVAYFMQQDQSMLEDHLDRLLHLQAQHAEA